MPVFAAVAAENSQRAVEIDCQCANIGYGSPKPE